jgi:hypothetical protein
MRKLLTLFSLVAWWAAGQSTDVDRRAKLSREIRDLIDQTPAAPPAKSQTRILKQRSWNRPLYWPARLDFRCRWALAPRLFSRIPMSESGRWR